MTQVLTTAELYQLIPETKQLENVNFKDFRQLLTNLIEKIEFSKKWEFVQYVNSNSNSSSFFIVREKPVTKNGDQPYLNKNRQPQSQKPIVELTEVKIQEKSPEPVKKVEEGVAFVEGIVQPKSESSIFSQSKMPW